VRNMRNVQSKLLCYKKKGRMESTLRKGKTKGGNIMSDTDLKALGFGSAGSSQKFPVEKRLGGGEEV